MRFTRSVLSTLLLGSSLVACAVLGDDRAASSEDEHTEGEPTFAQHPWLWADETEDEFRRGRGQYLSLDHPMTVRLQFWLDQMDAALRAKYPDRLRATPRPKIIVEKTDEANAWVSSIPVSLDVHARTASDAGVDVDGGVPARPAFVAAEYRLDRTGTISTASYAFRRPHDSAMLRDFVGFFSDNFATCKLSLEGGEIVVGAGCRMRSSVSAANRFSYYATAKYITVTSSLILAVLDEDRIVSTLAHELGHFYRSHSNIPTDVMNYFYSLEDAHAHKPAADPRFMEQTTKARTKLRKLSAGDWEMDWTEENIWTEENTLMAERGLGFYTTEQEADELSLELLTKVGIPPGVAIDDMLFHLKGADLYGGEAPGAMRWAECSTLREQGFKDANGKIVSVPVGDPSNAHHNLCFRIFNMAREIAAHRYPIAPHPTPPGEPWSRVVTRLAAEVDPPPALVGDAGPAEPVEAGAPLPSDGGTD